MKTPNIFILSSLSIILGTIILNNIYTQRYHERVDSEDL